MMVYLNLGLTLFLLGLFLLVRRSNQLMLIGGIISLLAGIVLFTYWTNLGGIEGDVIGMQITKYDQAELAGEIKHFEKRSEAMQYYQDKHITRYILFVKTDGTTKVFYDAVKIKLTPEQTKKVSFTGDGSKGKTGLDAFQNFFLRSELMIVYSSPEAKKLK